MSAPTSDRAGIRQTIRALRAAGYVITGGHDGAEDVTYEPTATEAEIVADMTACDDSTLYVRLPGSDEAMRRESFVYFVLGNEPYEVICDHGVSLAPVLDPLTDGWQE